MDEDTKKNLIHKLSAEHASVHERFKRLDTFLLGETYETLPYEDRIDLSSQWRYMSGYVTVLQRRIDRLNGVLIGE